MRDQVGILTWHQYENFGSMLQAFALQKTLEQLKIRNEIVDYFNESILPAKKKSERLKYLLKKVLMAVKLDQFVGDYYSFQRFYFDYLCKSKTVTNRDQLKSLSMKYYCIICGGDQIWAPNVYDPVYMADFVDEENIRLVSYAASIGLNDIPEKLRPIYRDLLSRFSCVSVREEKGKELLKELCNIDAKVVLDPTFLLDVSVYRKIQKKVLQVKKPYIFCYFLNKHHDYGSRVQSFATACGCEICGISSSTQDNNWMHILRGIGPQEFLWLVDNAEYIFTDSYHGTIFSLLFQKKFWTFERFRNDDPICQNSRIQQLNKMFDLESKILSSKEIPDVNVNLDYEVIQEKMQIYIKESKNFLREALN